MHKNKQKALLLVLAVASKLHPLRFGSVTYCGHPNKLMKLHLWRFKLDILQSQLPYRHPKT